MSVSRVVTACVVLIIGSFGGLLLAGEIWDRMNPTASNMDFGQQMGVVLNGMLLSLAVSLVLMVLISWWAHRFAQLPWWWGPASWIATGAAYWILSLLYPISGAAVATPVLVATAAVAPTHREVQRPLLSAAGIFAAVGAAAFVAMLALAGILW